MLRRAHAGMAVGKLAGLRFGERHQFRHGFDGYLAGTASTFAAMNTCEIGAKS